MAFVNEPVPEEEKGRFEDINIWYNPETDDSLELFKWTIDRERDIFLIPTGSMGGPEVLHDYHDYFALCWRGEVIKFQGYCDIKGNEETGLIQIVSWSVFGLQIPDCLDSKEAEIHQLIKEALTAYGWIFNGDKVEKVHIEFSNRIFVWQ